MRNWCEIIILIMQDPCSVDKKICYIYVYYRLNSIINYQYHWLWFSICLIVANNPKWFIIWGKCTMPESEVTSTPQSIIIICTIFSIAVTVCLTMGINSLFKSEVVPLQQTVLPLTHWGRVTHICVGKLTIIGSDNGLSPERRQAIIWTNAGILLIGSLGTNFSEI